jgi:NADH-quinone oxidoreductase subunit E
VTQLQALGIYQFAQIAAWSPADVSRIEAALSGAGRVGREDWIAQARLLVQANKEA